jgi:hypothetical protein
LARATRQFGYKPRHYELFFFNKLHAVLHVATVTFHHLDPRKRLEFRAQKRYSSEILTSGDKNSFRASYFFHHLLEIKTTVGCHPGGPAVSRCEGRLDSTFQWHRIFTTSRKISSVQLNVILSTSVRDLHREAMSATVFGSGMTRFCLIRSTPLLPSYPPTRESGPPASARPTTRGCRPWSRRCRSCLVPFVWGGCLSLPPLKG